MPVILHQYEVSYLYSVEFYLKFFFVLLLLSGALFGCLGDDSKNNQSTTDQQPAAVTNNKTSKTIKIENAYNELKKEKTQFVQQL